MLRFEIVVAKQLWWLNSNEGCSKPPCTVTLKTLKRRHNHVTNLNFVIGLSTVEGRQEALLGFKEVAKGLSTGGCTPQTESSPGETSAVQSTYALQPHSKKT